MGFIDDFVAKQRARHLFPEDKPEERECSKCKNTLPLTSEHFWRGSSSWGFDTVCKKCRSAHRRARHRMLNPIPEKPASFCCKVCGVEKPFTSEYFRKSPSHRWGLRYKCNKCRRKPIKPRPRVPGGKLRCTCCERIKREEDFYRDRTKYYNKGREYKCKICSTLQRNGGGKKKYQQEHFGGRISFDWLWDYIQSPEFNPDNARVITTEEEKDFEIEDWTAWAS